MKTAPVAGRVPTEIDRREARQLPDHGTTGDRCTSHELGEDFAQEVGPMGWQQSGCADDIGAGVLGNYVNCILPVKLIQFQPIPAVELPPKFFDEYSVPIGGHLRHCALIQVLGCA